MEKISGMPGIEPVMAGCGAPMLPLCYAVRLVRAYLLSGTFLLKVRLFSFQSNGRPILSLLSPGTGGQRGAIDQLVLLLDPGRLSFAG